MAASIDETDDVKTKDREAINEKNQQIIDLNSVREM